MTDDNIPVIIKTLNGPEGSLVLFNEYVCYRMAMLLKIPMPVSGICLINQDTVIYNDCVTLKQFGYGFYSTYLNKSVTLVDTIIPLMQNKEDFFKILLFDHVIFNTDRNPGNLLVQYYKNNITLRVIDHSHVFINQAIWDASCLNRAIAEKDYFSTRILDNNTYLYNMFFHHVTITKKHFDKLKIEFCNKITKEALCNIFTDVPSAWMPTSHDTDALTEYILYRIDHLDDICNTITNYLK